ncbi:MAG: dienelactone hydrolase family protein [Alphaproteobacteria bacterium]|nr:dienelactone hydrolase family protein [Alphaproteobacteria bacterium]
MEPFAPIQARYGRRSGEVWVAGEGPGVLLIHEIPGLHPEVVRFGRRLVDEGFTVWMPVLFGDTGRPVTPGYDVREVCRACVSRAFTVWRAGVRSPITDDLRDLARQLSEATGGPVGAVGMCLTGGFALALVVDPWVTAPVLSQPSVPFGLFPWQRRDLGIDASTLARVKERVEEGVCVLGLRFTGDPLVPSARFERLRQELGDGFEAVELPGRKHAVLSLHWDEGAVARTVAFLREHTALRSS